MKPVELLRKIDQAKELGDDFSSHLKELEEHRLETINRLANLIHKSGFDIDIDLLYKSILNPLHDEE